MGLVHVELVCDGSTEMDTHMRFLQVVSHVDGMAVTAATSFFPLGGDQGWALNLHFFEGRLHLLLSLYLAYFANLDFFL